METKLVVLDSHLNIHTLSLERNMHLCDYRDSSCLITYCLLIRKVMEDQIQLQSTALRANTSLSLEGQIISEVSVCP